MKSTLYAATFAALALPGWAAGQAELPPLNTNKRVLNEFLAAAVGDEIRKNCPTISAKMFTVLWRAQKLEYYVKSLGYTDEDIRELRKSDANKAMMETMRDDYLARRNVEDGVAASYCRLGEWEIAQGSLIGSLIRQH